MKPLPFRYAAPLMVLLGVVLPTAGGVLVRALAGVTIWPLEPLHATIETLGAAIALALASLLLILRRFGREPAEHLWMSCAFLGMGLLDGFHAATPPGNLFVWLHSLAVLVGGVLFLLVWLPERLAEGRLARLMPSAVIVATLVLAMSSVLWSGMLPLMVRDGAFTRTAQACNVTGGAAFLLAGARFVLLYRTRPAWEEFLFAVHCGLFGVAGLVFELSALWDPAWWWWHVLRLLAYAVALRFLMTTFWAAQEELRELNESLEHRVEERAAALRFSEQRYRQLTEGTRDAIVVADQFGRITLFNPAARQVFGYDEDEVLGRCLTLLMPPEYHDDYFRGLHRYLETRETQVMGRTIELRGRRKNGEIFPIEIALSAIDLPDGIVFLGAIRDATERQRMQARLVQSEKMASLGLLSAGMAHEINNPLAYVANNLAVLDREIRDLTRLAIILKQARADLAGVRPDLAEQTDEVDLTFLTEQLPRIVNSTRQGVKRVADIVHNLRGFARLDRAEVDRVDIHESLNSSLEMIRGRLARRNIQVETRFADLPPVYCQPAQINQVFLNLLVNAMQAIETNHRDGGRIEIVTRAEGDSAIVEIADDGGGIPPDVLPRIFDPFFTTKGVGEGVGLGLSISHGIVSDHGGRLEVESQPGQGSRFRVILSVAGKREVTHDDTSKTLSAGRG